MLGILATVFGIASRTDDRAGNRSKLEKLAEQRRWEDEYFWQGRTGTPGSWLGR